VADALPDLPLAGTITSISPYYGEDRGDVTYAVRLRQKPPTRACAGA
jgi:hypothetical protein